MSNRREERFVTKQEIKEGVPLIAGHPVLLYLDGWSQGEEAANADEERPRIFEGTIDGPLGPLCNWPFRLLRDGQPLESGDLAPGKAVSQFENGAWLTDSKGRYRFEDVPGELSVEGLLPGAAAAQPVCAGAVEGPLGPLRNWPFR